MSKTFIKVVHTQVRELYEIEAETAEQAEANWTEGTLVFSETEFIVDDEYPVEDN